MCVCVSSSNDVVEGVNSVFPMLTVSAETSSYSMNILATMGNWPDACGWYGGCELLDEGFNADEKKERANGATLPDS